jgi:rhodanese-related sulfurtransferase
MFLNSAWKSEMAARLQELELQISDLKKSDSELKSQNHRLLQMLKNIGRKMVSRLPISIESLEKGLAYDLIFPEEVATWKTSVTGGVVLDLRPAYEYVKGAIPGTYNIPLEQLSSRFETLARDLPILLVCENGIKSVAAFELLNSKAYQFLYVLKGGMSLYEGPLQNSEERPKVIETVVEAVAVQP